MPEVHYIFYSDPGHGWGKVSTAMLRKYCSTILNKISHYSYITNGKQFVYLEEDLDLPLVINHLRINGIETKCTETKHTNIPSKIRNNLCYSTENMRFS